MTEWNATQYARIDGLQQAMASRALGTLDLKGSERVLDVGCGDGGITARIADRVPGGFVLGVDASHDMVSFARSHHAGPAYPNLSFECADARNLGSVVRDPFDRVVSFNALHWIQDHGPVLRGIREALKPLGTAHLRFVPEGPRQSLEDILQAAACRPRWAPAFQGAAPPFRHFEPEEYRGIAEAAGFQVQSILRTDHDWDFGSPDAFEAFARITFVEWTRHLPEHLRMDFIREVLGDYRVMAVPGQDLGHRFLFYQMDVVLVAPLP